MPVSLQVPVDGLWLGGAAEHCTAAAAAHCSEQDSADASAPRSFAKCGVQDPSLSWRSVFADGNACAAAMVSDVLLFWTSHVPTDARRRYFPGGTGSDGGFSRLVRSLVSMAVPLLPSHSGRACIHVPHDGCSRTLPALTSALFSAELTFTEGVASVELQENLS